MNGAGRLNPNKKETLLLSPYSRVFARIRGLM
jgi:hypothetical protein